MGLKLKHRIGLKISKRHTSFIEAAAQIVDFLILNPSVTKISGGKVGSGRAQPYVSIALNPSSLKLCVHYEGNCQIVHVYTICGTAKAVAESIYQYFEDTFLAKKERRARQISQEKRAIHLALNEAAA